MRVTPDSVRCAGRRWRPRFAAGGGLSCIGGAILLITFTGCGRTADPESPTSNSATATASDTIATGVPTPGLDASSAPESLAMLPPGPISQPPSLMAQEPAAPPGGQSAATTDEQALSAALFDDADVQPAAPAVATRRLQLAADLPAERLIDFLRLVDTEMQNVATGRKQLFDVDEANAELTRLAKLKLEASGQLAEQSAPQSAAMALAIRGKLQALSHLAALGNLPAAEQLEELARQHVASEDAAVALDSQLVLVGLAMERLQNGTASDASEILSLVERIAAARQTPDVSALMVMGQARAVLQQYGYDEAANKVRAVIVDLFANHPNPNVSAMAVQLVGSAQLAGVDELLSAFSRRQSVSLDQWKEAVEALLDESPDLAAIQYLASAALQFEAFGNDELTDVTFEVLAQSELGEREAAEVATAAEARETRSAIIGQQIPIDLPSVDGRPLSLESYAGRVVLMPFWAIAFPDSLAVLQTLDQIRQQFPGQVEIVGMNLDVQDAPADEFLRQSPVQFRSFQSVSPAGGGANEIATRFGVASLPFVVIIGPDSAVAAINMTGQGLARQVQELLSP